MACTETHRVLFGMHMLTEEADDWWGNTRQRLKAAGNEITWVVFKGEFLERIYDKDSRAQSVHYKSLSEKRGKQLNHGKLYNVPFDKGKQRISYGRRPSVGGASAPIKCYRCGRVGHHANECKSDENKCFKCGKSGHLIADCKTNVPTCYNCREPSQKPKKAQTGGKVFALTGSQPNISYRLIRGTFYIHDIPLIAIIDTGATHSFIYANYVRKMGLISSTLNS
ncbi:serine/arginine-rich splicing factor RS2Z32-like [Lathyrus oleraceus]|uniref:serine/arginine-rich splicing factor RS2Z32-like n=1 Tax=Pisum sativum TaxID=3888 RepID=UPI0021D398EB|nr:serine/arginine-rich splicing factor RS2Z32-like [Pisum sativum]